MVAVGIPTKNEKDNQDEARISEENNNVENVVSEDTSNAEMGDHVIVDPSNVEVTPGIEQVGDFEKEDNEPDRKERSLSQLSVDQVTDSLSAYSPTISEYGTPPNSPITSDAVVEIPKSPEKLAPKDVEVKENIEPSQSKFCRPCYEFN